MREEAAGNGTGGEHPNDATHGSDVHLQELQDKKKEEMEE